MIIMVSNKKISVVVDVVKNVFLKIKEYEKEFCCFYVELVKF